MLCHLILFAMRLSHGGQENQVGPKSRSRAIPALLCQLGGSCYEAFEGRAEISNF